MTYKPSQVLGPNLASNWNSCQSDGVSSMKNAGQLSGITPIVQTPGQAANVNGNVGDWYTAVYTAATTGSLAAITPFGNALLYATHRINHRPKFSFRFYTGSDGFVSYRMWAGLFETSPFSSDTLPGSDGIGFRASTAAGDTNWKIVSLRAGVQVIADTGVPIVAGNKYDLSIELNGVSTAAKWSIVNNAGLTFNGVVAAANVPSNPANVDCGLACGIMTLANTQTWFMVSSINSESLGR